jgi:NitT/TauT family transport system ATP-binding protein
MTDFALSLLDVRCSFATPGGLDEYTAIKNVSFDLEVGEFVSIVGPTGCGKSTILNVAAGLLPPSSGSVQVLGENLLSINRHAGYMFQGNALMPWRSAKENIMLGLEYHDIAKEERASIANEWLRKVGLHGFGDRYPHQLSGGMQKRIALAQTLALDPKIILMDEPFSALDVQTRQLMENELLQLCKASSSQAGKSVLFITHDLDEAIAMSDRVIVMSAGPASHPIGDFRIDLPKPRDVAEIKSNPKFHEYYSLIWDVLRSEVMKSYSLQMRPVDHV